MEGKEKVRRTLLQFNQELSEKVAPAFIKSYECEMKCYENFTQLENADDCAELCRKETNFIRGKLQTEYQKNFAESTEVCNKDQVCTNKAIDAFRTSLWTTLNQLN